METTINKGFSLLV